MDLFAIGHVGPKFLVDGLVGFKDVALDPITGGLSCGKLLEA